MYEGNSGGAIVAYHEPSGSVIERRYSDRAGKAVAIQDVAESIAHLFQVPSDIAWGSITLWDDDPTDGARDIAPINVHDTLQVVKAVNTIMGVE